MHPPPPPTPAFFPLDSNQVAVSGRRSALQPREKSLWVHKGHKFLVWSFRLMSQVEGGGRRGERGGHKTGAGKFRFSHYHRFDHNTFWDLTVKAGPSRKMKQYSLVCSSHDNCNNKHYWGKKVYLYYSYLWIFCS